MLDLDFFFQSTLLATGESWFAVSYKTVLYLFYLAYSLSSRETEVDTTLMSVCHLKHLINTLSSVFNL